MKIAPPPRLTHAIQSARDWADLHPRLVEILFFTGGVLLDATTRVQDVSRPFIHLQLAFWLLLACTGIVVETRLRRHSERTPQQESVLEWTSYAVQFALGALLGAYTMHYFYATTWGPSLVFLVGLALMQLLNEFWASHLTRVRWRLAMLTFCTNAWLLFAIPVFVSAATLPNAGLLGLLAPLAPWLNPFPSWWLQAAAATGAIVVSSLVVLGCEIGRTRHELRVRLPRYALNIGGVLVGLSVLDAMGLIPPVPLSVVETAIVHDVQRTRTDLMLRYRRPIWAFWRKDDRTAVLGPEDSTLSCFTPVFAPPGMQIDIVHVWEWWSEEQSQWIERMRRPMQRPVQGGRERGFRTWSTAQHTLKNPDGTWRTGWWRCRTETASGREIARKNFWLDAQAHPPDMVERTYD